MRKALIIGINDYEEPLNYCVNDAKEFKAAIEKNYDGKTNFEVDLQIKIATKAQLKDKIESFFKKDAETALLYFAGHGTVKKGVGILVTPDQEKRKGGLSMNDILIAVNKSAIRNKILIFDCCNSGSFGASEFAAGVSLIMEGTSILTAARKDEDAVEGNGHGVFTNLLLNGLKGGAADIRGHVTSGSVYAYIDQALGAHEQRPVFKTNVSNFVPLKTIEPKIPLQTLLKLSTYFSTADQKLKLNPSFEFKNDPKAKEPLSPLIKPYANKTNVAIFQNLQKLQSVGLVEPVGAKFMFFAAIKSKWCRLTPIGQHYWNLVNQNRLR